MLTRRVGHAHEKTRCVPKNQQASAGSGVGPPGCRLAGPGPDWHNRGEAASPGRAGPGATGGGRMMGSFGERRPGAMLVLIAAALGVGWPCGAGRAGDVPSPGAAPGPTAEEYRARRAGLLAEVRTAEAGAGALRAAIAGAEGGGAAAPPVLVVLVGRGEPGDDAKFRQANDFHYLTGVDVAFAAAILRLDSGEEALYLPPRNPRMERYNGPTLGPGPDAAAATGFARVASSAEFLADLFRAMGDPGAGRTARGATVYLVDAEPKATSAGRDAWLARLVAAGAPNARLKELAPLVHERRKAKSPAEVALLRRAIVATGEAQAAVLRLARPGAAENQLEGAILGAFLAAGASRAGFPSIVGSGPNSTVLHYGRNDRTMAAGDLVVVDIGAEVGGYTADITRTVPVDGRFTPRQREVYRLVLEAQAGAAREVKPGESTIGSLNRWVREFFRASPLRAKGEDGAEHTMDHFFAHGLGHHLGLDVHDVGDASKPLAPGQVFTIEPGLYLPSEGFGIRIEDDYLVTADGVEKLSAAIPSAPDDVERAMAEGRAAAVPRP